MANYYHNQPGSQVQTSYPSAPAVPPTAVGYTTTTQHVPYLSSYPAPPPYSYPLSDLPPQQPYPGTLISNVLTWIFTQADIIRSHKYIIFHYILCSSHTLDVYMF